MLTAAAIMNPKVITIKGLATVASATQSMRAHHTQTLIVDRRHPHDAYGIVTATDISSKVLAYGRDPRTIRVYEIMTKPCISVNPDLAVEYVARLFGQWQIHSAPVIKDELLGIITVTDLITKSDFLENPKAIALTAEMQKAIHRAKLTCQTQGHDSSACAQAWAAVEELEAEVAYQQATKVPKTALEEYLEENPKAVDHLLIDNWCSG
ncbi:CBS domain-containing protein [[Synechococcus] sp. NIES-970]|nr:CBS domain-containing protein [[Synechococcus] sp. NIES-970]